MEMWTLPGGVREETYRAGLAKAALEEDNGTGNGFQIGVAQVLSHPSCCFGCVWCSKPPAGKLYYTTEVGSAAVRAGNTQSVVTSYAICSGVDFATKL